MWKVRFPSIPQPKTNRPSGGVWFRQYRHDKFTRCESDDGTNFIAERRRTKRTTDTCCLNMVKPIHFSSQCNKLLSSITDNSPSVRHYPALLLYGFLNHISPSQDWFKIWGAERYLTWTDAQQKKWISLTRNVPRAAKKLAHTLLFLSFLVG